MIIEQEPSVKWGPPVDVATIFLVGSECRFRCTMCDLWKYTHPEPTPPGHLVAQVESAIQSIGSEVANGANKPRWVKLYNASNFFASTNVPVSDLPKLARAVENFDRVIVENHPKLLNDEIRRFADRLNGQLEVAVGLETVHPQTLEGLNKSMTLDDFQRCSNWLAERGIDVRSFVILRPPGMNATEGEEWAIRSIEFAAHQGVRHVSLVPLRSGNGAIEQLAERGLFTPPTASSIERVMAEVEKFSCVVTVDLWDWERIEGLCQRCSTMRRDVLAVSNLTQRPPTDIPCDCKTR